MSVQSLDREERRSGDRRGNIKRITKRNASASANAGRTNSHSGKQHLKGGSGGNHD